jgi:hypothetical protein
MAHLVRRAQRRPVFGADTLPIRVLNESALSHQNAHVLVGLAKQGGEPLALQVDEVGPVLVTRAFRIRR